MGVFLGPVSAPATIRSITGGNPEQQVNNRLPGALVSTLNRSNSFHELRQVATPTDPRKLEPLNQEEKRLLLAEVINQLAGNASPKKEPVVHIITGQMGAGKSTITNNISTELKGDCLIIDYDELKQYIPGYTEESSKGYPGTVPGCKEAARYLEDGLRKYGFENRLNMVTQASIQGNGTEMLTLVKACKENGFRTSLTVLAVDKATSNVGILSRYESALKNINLGEPPSGGARRTPAAYHEDAYQSLTNPERYEELSSKLDEVIVRGRNGHSYYQSTTAISPKEIVRAIETGRQDTQKNHAKLFENLSNAVSFNLNYSSPELRQ
ncbi:zeta toxin family protein [Pseudomonas kilonensis]|uniref:zeta toxin family protein n=1 Tax=Pseudomonas kilonensis TaxID=132476 RepID=UPI0009B86A42|nr:zeta toxin family protein [Pseudomonas kilonensis]